MAEPVNKTPENKPAGIPQAAPIDWEKKAKGLEKKAAVLEAVRKRNWHSETEALDNMLALAELNAEGTGYVVNGKPLDEAVSLLAGSKPHWLKEEPNKTTKLGFAAHTPLISAEITYEHLLKPENTAKLAEMIKKDPNGLQALRNAHFAKLGS